MEANASSKRFLYLLQVRAAKVLNVVLASIPFALVWYLYYAKQIAVPLSFRGSGVVIVLFLVMYCVFGKTYDAFLISLVRISDMVYSQALTAFFSDCVLYVVICLITRSVPNIGFLSLAFLMQIALDALWSWLAHVWYFKRFPARRTLIIYDERQDMEYLIESYGLEKKFDVINIVSIEEYLRDGGQDLTGYQTVFACGLHSHERNIVLKRCIMCGVELYQIPRIGDVIMSGAVRRHLFHLPILSVTRFCPGPGYAFIKRLMDVVLSAAALVVFSPFMAIIAIAIKLDDGGTVFYRQCRLTKDGREFDILKFRSMKMDAEEEGGAQLSTGRDDVRATRVGRILRAAHLDEVPQFINVLKGELSLVGPRPERPGIAEKYQRTLPEFVLRLQVKAGMTGYAQVYGKYSTDPYDKLLMDLMYIAHPSIGEDLKIMFATVKVLFELNPDGTEKKGKSASGNKAAKGRMAERATAETDTSDK